MKLKLCMCYKNKLQNFNNISLNNTEQTDNFKYINKWLMHFTNKLNLSTNFCAIT